MYLDIGIEYIRVYRGIILNNELFTFSVKQAQ